MNFWVQKQIQNFGKDFSVKSREKIKLKKNKKSNFFRKKNDFFIVFPIRIFSWETDKLVPKLAKSDTNMCLLPIYNFCEKKI